jgi:antibiotic biosynthesis monooxygenase (ABM) superfamily enzyme
MEYFIETIKEYFQNPVHEAKFQEWLKQQKKETKSISA